MFNSMSGDKRVRIPGRLLSKRSNDKHTRLNFRTTSIVFCLGVFALVLLIVGLTILLEYNLDVVNAKNKRLLQLYNDYPANIHAEMLAKSSKPTFVLHVGPPKIGTTSIQCGLTAICKDLADLDNTFYLGKACISARKGVLNNGEDMLFQVHHMVVRELHKEEGGPIVTQMKSRMDHHFELGNNILLSEESLAWRLSDMKYLHELLKPWNSVVSLSYRRYYDWVTSRYFHEHTAEYTHHLWPHERRIGRVKHVPSIASYVEQQLEEIKNQSPRNVFSEYSKHMTISTIQRYVSYFSNIQVYMFHDNSTLLENFVCNGLPKEAGGETCAYLKKNNTVQSEYPDAVNVTPPQAMDALRLIREAYKRGWLGNTTTTSRKNIGMNAQVNLNEIFCGLNQFMAVKVIERQLRLAYTVQNKDGSKMYQPPLTCMNQDLLDRLKNVTIMYEKYMIDYGYMDGPFDESNFQNEYTNFIKKQKHCFLDVTSALSQPRWKGVFDKLKARNDDLIVNTNSTRYVVMERSRNVDNTSSMLNG